MNILSHSESFGQYSDEQQAPIVIKSAVRQDGPPVLSHHDIERQLDELARLSEMLLADEAYSIKPLACAVPLDFKLSVVIPVFNEQETIYQVLGRVSALGLEVCGEVQHRLMVPALGGEQQPLGIQVVHDGDVVLATAQAGLVDAHDLHALEALQSTRLVNVELDASPQLLVLAVKQRGRVAHR